MKKIHHRVYVEKHDSNTYSVVEYTFDERGNTVNMKKHGDDYSFKSAHALKRDILECYK